MGWGVIVVDDDWQDTGCGRPEHHFTSRLLGLLTTADWWRLEDRVEKLFVSPSNLIGNC